MKFEKKRLLFVNASHYKKRNIKRSTTFASKNTQATKISKRDKPYKTWPWNTLQQKQPEK